jgi:hypothetical protein
VIALCSIQGAEMCLCLAFSIEYAVRRESSDVLSGYCGGGTPGPIPNPVVKPSSADGTAA